MVPWYHSTTVPWYHATMLPCYHATMLPWHHGTMVLRYHGTMVPWCHGTMVPWYHGTRDPLDVPRVGPFELPGSKMVRPAGRPAGRTDCPERLENQNVSELSQISGLLSNQISGRPTRWASRGSDPFNFKLKMVPPAGRPAGRTFLWRPEADFWGVLGA